MIIRALNKTAELHIYRELPNELKSKYEKLDYIKLKGYVENNKILEAMSEAEYFVYITEFQETFCLSVLEAQLMGCLCITSNTAALETTNQGIVLENNNRETLIQKLNNITDKENIIKKSINWALNQTWKNKMKEWNLLY
jgi:glycosyltransferase involved in cell wall biosynthesis